MAKMLDLDLTTVSPCCAATLDVYSDRRHLQRDKLDAAGNSLRAQFREAEFVMKRARSQIRRVKVVLAGNPWDALRLGMGKQVPVQRTANPKAGMVGTDYDAVYVQEVIEARAEPREIVVCVSRARSNRQDEASDATGHHRDLVMARHAIEKAQPLQIHWAGLPDFVIVETED